MRMGRVHCQRQIQKINKSLIMQCSKCNSSTDHAASKKWILETIHNKLFCFRLILSKILWAVSKKVFLVVRWWWWWCTLQENSVYFKNAGKIAHMMTPLKFYHKMENDDHCSKVYISMNSSGKWVPENEEEKNRGEKNLWCVEETYRVFFFVACYLLSFYAKPCSTDHHFSVGHHHHHCTHTDKVFCSAHFILNNLCWSPKLFRLKRAQKAEKTLKVISIFFLLGNLLVC